ncbi:LysR family transcriptional regulator [Acidocella sp.]|uniref:LysR family transcriptional regulator n=1 Tax=Acidocella sp. TaxID=50710 RepID=UPI0026332678|nr:LysR family transcriptional regulator [Acidocella sp.]
MDKHFDWDLLKSFLGLARAGKLTLAAKRLGVEHSTLSRHLAALETALGLKLFERRVSGYVLTPHGEALLRRAEAMEALVLSIEEDAGQSRARVSGTVRVGVPDGFGTRFLAPRIGRLAAAHPGLHIELAAAPRGFSLSKREADLAISLSRPSVGRIHARKLTDYELGLYGVPALAAQVARREDVARLAFISYIDDMLFAPELDYAASVTKGIEPRLRLSNVLAQHEAAASGAGLCVLPCFLADDDARLVRVLGGEIRLVRSFWLLVPSDIRELARVQVTSAFIAGEVQREAGLFLPSGRG